MSQSNFVEFSKPFIDALKETFEMMVQTEIKPHTPKIKTSPIAHGDITAIIGMNGSVEKDGETKDFKGLLALSWPEPIYVALAGRMLFEEYTEYNSRIQKDEFNDPIVEDGIDAEDISKEIKDKFDVEQEILEEVAREKKASGGIAMMLGE